MTPVFFLIAQPVLQTGLYRDSARAVFLVFSITNERENWVAAEGLKIEFYYYKKQE